MKKILFLTILLANLTAYASHSNNKKSRSLAAAASQSSTLTTTAASSPVDDLLQKNPSSIKNFLQQSEKALDQDLQAPPPSPQATALANQENNDFDTTEDNDGSAAKVVVHEKSYLNELWRLCAITVKKQNELTDALQQRLGLTSEYDKLHKLAIQGQLENHFNALNQHDAGAGGRFVDTAINTAIKDKNEVMLKAVLLDIEQISTSSLSEDTKERIAIFIKECSHTRKRAIVDVVTTYLQECDQDAYLVKKFTNSKPQEQKRESFENVIIESQKKIEELTKHFSGDTLL